MIRIIEEEEILSIAIKEINCFLIY